MTGRNAPSIKLIKPTEVQAIYIFIQFKIWVILYVSIYTCKQFAYEQALSSLWYFPSLEQTVTSTFKPDVVPAVNRWLKKAGNEGKLPLACPLGCLFRTESTESCPVLTFLCFNTHHKITYTFMNRHLVLKLNWIRAYKSAEWQATGSNLGWTNTWGL